MIVVTLLSTMCVRFRICAAAIRASSCVSSSSRFRASSISFFPTSFFRYFSERRLADDCISRREQRTPSILPHLFRCNREDVQHFDHYRHDYVGHCVCRSHCGIRLEALEEVLDTLEEIDKGILAGINILCSL